MSKEASVPEVPLFEQPWLGSTLTFLASLSFFFVLPLLPLVGPSAVDTPHMKENFLTFLAVLLLALLFAVGGFLSKSKRRKEDRSPFPYVSAALVVVYVLMLICLLTGLFSI